MALLFSPRGIASRYLAGILLPEASISWQRAHTAPSPRPAITATRFLATTTPARADSKAAGKATGKATGKVTGKATGKKGRKGRQEIAKPLKLQQMLISLGNLSPRQIPPPLRMGRNRFLRHWTIHRAWLIFRRQQREKRETELMRLYQSMSAACEELRLTSGPATRPEGYLYRKAMEKMGVYGHHGIPIEYARPQTDSPAREPWNHDWRR